MPEYTTKVDLYSFVERLRNRIGINPYDYPLNTTSILSSFGNVCIEYNNFKSKGLCGVAFIGPKTDTIILNSQRTPIEQNFDCAHELIHISKHRNNKTECFQCFESARPSQNFSLEWQANEGAAEFLVPYREVLQIVYSYRNGLSYSPNIRELKEQLSYRFGVSDAVIKYRLESLKYEIFQYLNGEDLDHIKILSKSQLSKLRWQVRSINDMENSAVKNENELFKLLSKKSKPQKSPFSSGTAYNDSKFLKAEDRWLFDV